MAHPYTTRARLELFVAGRGGRLEDLLDRDKDGTEDTGLLDRTIKTACNRIDGEVAQVYRTPLAVDISTTESGGLVEDLTDKLVAGELYAWVDPDTADAKLRDEVYAYLDMVRARRTTLPGQTPIAATTGRSGVRWESAGTEACGGVTDGQTGVPYTSNTVKQTYGL